MLKSTEGRVADRTKTRPEDREEHVLEVAWMFWYLDGFRCYNNNWDVRLHAIAEVKTLSQFAGLFNIVVQPSQLRYGSDYYFFKAGIRPTWEDPSNVLGGRWVLPFSDNRNNLDLTWRELLMMLAGNWCDQARTDVCGAVANIRRRGSKICVWTNDCRDAVNVVALGKSMKEILNYNGTMYFESHKDCEQNINTDCRIKHRI